jgi:hypothetical protein
MCGCNLGTSSEVTYAHRADLVYGVGLHVVSCQKHQAEVDKFHARLASASRSTP